MPSSVISRGQSSIRRAMYMLTMQSGNRSAVTGKNYMAASNLAAVCSRHGIKLLSFSSDLVFGGGQQHPYVEKDRTGPLNIYGHSKRLAEKAILSHQPNALIVRTAAFSGRGTITILFTRLPAPSRQAQPLWPRMSRLSPLLMCPILYTLVLTC